MKIVVQRVKEGQVTVNQEVVGAIKAGFVVLVGITHTDTKDDANYLANKLVHLRVFEDENGKMNDSVLAFKGAVLSISQFTLYSDTRKGRRPNFMEAAKPDVAEPLYRYFNEQVEALGVSVETGRFGEMMDVELVNDGPVTLVIDSEERHKKG